MPVRAPSPANWPALRSKLMRAFDRELAGRLREPNLEAVRTFVERAGDAVASLNRLAGVPADIARLLEQGAVQGSLLSLLSCRAGDPTLAADLLALAWAGQASAFGIEPEWVPHVSAEDAARFRQAQEDARPSEFIALFNLAVGEHLRKVTGGQEGRAMLRRALTSLGLSFDEAALIFHVRGETVRRWEQGVSGISDERMSTLHVLDAALTRLVSLFRPERLPSVIRRPADLFGGERALDWILRGRAAEVADRYDVALSYQE